MSPRSLLAVFSLVFLALGAASESQALANRVFVSARSGNNGNACDNINTPCQTLTGALAQLNPDGEAIVLDSGGYGKFTVTQGVTIEAPAGVTAFIHPSSGEAILINAPGATVTLRGLVLNVGTGNGIDVFAVGTLNVENCSISGFANTGIIMGSGGRLNVKGTDIKGGLAGIFIANSSGTAEVSIDHCHLDGNSFGFLSQPTSPGSVTTAASNSTANHNSNGGWVIANTGATVLSLEFCTGSENGSEGLSSGSSNALTLARYSNCTFANNGSFGVSQSSAGVVESRANNSITGNVSGATSGTIGTYLPM